MENKLKADVVVVGGGSAGFIAAIAAARNGADCLLVERYGFLGGTVANIFGLAAFQDRNGKQIVGGIGQEVVQELIKLGGSPGHIPDPIGESLTPIDPELFKYVAMKMTKEAGVRFLLHTLFIETMVIDGNINSIIVYNKSGRQIMEGKVFIDSTGDGDVAASAGAPYEKGRGKNGALQPVTMTFRMANFDKKKFVDYLRTHPEELEKADTWTEGFTPEYFEKRQNWPFFKGLDKLVVKVKKETGYELPRDRVHFIILPKEGQVQINTTRITGIDGSKAEDLTRAEIEGREQVMEVANFLIKYVPGFESAYILDTPVQIGIRETRRIIGEYIVTEADVLEGRQFEDVIAKGIYPLDIHDVAGRGMRHIRVKTSYQIPYRCLLPKGVENLIVVGRCISTTHEALGALRVIPNCMAMGQAAGTAAALAVKKGISPKKLKVALLQQLLREQGAII